jgi:1,4-dihydroxy-2-naphthoyl-CoA hydrolase
LIFTAADPKVRQRARRATSKSGVGAGAMNDVNQGATKQPAFAVFLGLKVTHISPERVTGELPAREELNNRFGIMHGGAIMALADNLGGTATTANLKPGQSTTTIESKTNFFAAIPIGDIAYAECTPLHRGRTTMVWQTRVTRGDGRLCALVTQTQLVLDPGKK